MPGYFNATYQLEIRDAVGKSRRFNLGTHAFTGRTHRPSSGSRLHVSVHVSRTSICMYSFKHTCSRLKPELDLTYTTKLNAQKHEGSLRAHRVVFIVCILHLANALGPVRFRRCNTDLGPSLGYQNRQRVIPRRGELGTRPMVEIEMHFLH